METRSEASALCPTSKQDLVLTSPPPMAFLAAIYILGNVIGSFVAGPLADGLGRKKGMIVANIVTVIGTAVQAAATKRRDMIAGRVVLGIGSVMLGTFSTIIHS